MWGVQELAASRRDQHLFQTEVRDPHGPSNVKRVRRCGHHPQRSSARINMKLLSVARASVGPVRCSGLLIVHYSPAALAVERELQHRTLADAASFNCADSSDDRFGICLFSAASRQRRTDEA